MRPGQRKNSWRACHPKDAWGWFSYSVSRRWTNLMRWRYSSREEGHIIVVVVVIQGNNGAVGWSQALVVTGPHLNMVVPWQHQSPQRLALAYIPTQIRAGSIRALGLIGSGGAIRGVPDVGSAMKYFSEELTVLLCLLVILELISNGFTLWIYILLICFALKPWLFICIWMMSLLSRVWKDT